MQCNFIVFVTSLSPPAQVVQWIVERPQRPQSQSEAGPGNRWDESSPQHIFTTKISRNLKILTRRGTFSHPCHVSECLCLHACIHLTRPVCVRGAVSDVAGGYSASMLDAVRRALDSSKVLTIQDPEHDTLTFEEVFRLATLGGSQGKTHTPQLSLRNRGRIV